MREATLGANILVAAIVEEGVKSGGDWKEAKSGERGETGGEVEGCGEPEKFKRQKGKMGAGERKKILGMRGQKAPTGFRLMLG